MKMSLFHSRKSINLKKLQLLRCYTSLSSEEHSSKDLYPPILDISPKAKQEMEALEMHKKIQALNTVEEKLLALNVPRYYGWESVVLNEGKVPYNFLPLVQNITKTQLHQVRIESEPVPLTQDKLKQFVDKIKHHLEKILIYHTNSHRLTHELQSKDKPITIAEAHKLKSDNLVEQINRVLLAHLSREFDHLLSAQVDYRPRIEAFWNVGGFGLTEKERETREKKKVHKDLLNSPANKWIQYFGHPIVQLRSTLPLNAWSQATTSQTWDCGDFPYDPVLTYALETKRIHGVTIPGFWPDDEYKFGLLSFHSRPQTSSSAEDHEESVHASAILSSFAWLLGQACYHGFTIYNDLTYPLATQTVLTDGKHLSMYRYQMNTCVPFTESGKRNECYTSGTQELYSGIEGDQIKGWNEAALTELVSMYMNTPQERVGINMTPYLHPEESLVQHVEYQRKRVWLYNTYRYYVAHRPRRMLAPEIYDWEYIYKVAFETRPMDARKRFFERDEDPLEELRMGVGKKKYIPVALRPEAEKKKKWADEFYPDV